VSDGETIVLTALDDGVLTITLNRPSRLNAVVPALAVELVRALDGAARDGIRATVIRGAGRAFCSGWDLKEPGPRSIEDARADAEGLQEVTRATRRVPGPVVAAVHGYALGAGCEIALSCDLVLATESAVFGFPETGVGLAVTGGFTHLLPRVVGATRAKELVLLGRRFTAARAYELGLVNAVVADDALDSELEATLSELREKRPLALRIAKQEIDVGAQTDIETAMRLEVELAAQASFGNDWTARPT
jgi:2-(1,2-epoxy-1,2-dihydrophenyl)acetyl-CoA isomerase